MNRFEQQAKQLQALAHPTRLHILEILALSPVCVCDLVRLTGKRQPYISQHLAILRDAGLVVTERQGWNIFYRLNFSKLAELQAAVAMLSQPKQDVTVLDTRRAFKHSKLWHGIPRVEVPWHPTVHLEHCNGCKSCMETCLGDVFDWNGSLHHPIVARPENCIVYCRGCAMVCSQEAITLPNQDEVTELVRQLRIKYAS